VGHSILVIAWHLLSDDCDYADLGGDFFIRRDADRARQRALTQLQASATRSPSNPPPNTRGFTIQSRYPLRGRRAGVKIGAGCPPTPMHAWSLEAVIQSGAGARQQGRALLP
jgi:hypothetical protein